MLDVLIVDDEPVARQSLRYLIDWESHGFTIAAEAENGQQALDMLAERHYSLVLTDIRMPTMNGLELIERMREVADTEVAILSGYDDFEYARQGMRLGVAEYLLKPVDEEELIALLHRAASAVEEKRRAERRDRMGLTAIRDQFLRSLAQGAVRPRDIEEQLALLRMKPDVGRIALLLFELDFVYGAWEAGEHLTEQDTELRRYAVRNICEEIVGERGCVFELSEERYGVLLFESASEQGGTGSLMPSDLRAEAERLSAAAARFAKSSVTVGLGSLANGYGELHAAHQAAERALDRKFLIGPGSVLEPSGSEDPDRDGRRAGTSDRQADAGNRMEATAAELTDAVRLHRSVEAFAALDRLRDEFQAAGVSAAQAKPVVIELFVQLFRIVREAGASEDGLFDPSIGDYERIMRTKTVEQLFRISREKCAAALELLQRTSELRPNSVVDTLKRIVAEGYRDNISLRSVAQQIYMNPTYLGKLFKANTGMMFHDYLLQVRMERAKELLCSSDMKVYEIAEAVGYGELDWFYKRFKAYAGLSPSEYRAGGRPRGGASV